MTNPVSFSYSNYERFVQNESPENDFVLRYQEKEGRKVILFEENGLWTWFKTLFFYVFSPSRYAEYDLQKIVDVFNSATSFDATGTGVEAFKTVAGYEALRKLLDAKVVEFNNQNIVEGSEDDDNYNDFPEANPQLEINRNQISTVFANSLFSEQEKLKRRIIETHREIHNNLMVSETVYEENRGRVALSDDDKAALHNLYRAVKGQNIWATWSDALKVQFLLRTTDMLDPADVTFLEAQIRSKLPPEDTNGKTAEQIAKLLTPELITNIATEQIKVVFPTDAQVQAMENANVNVQHVAVTPSPLADKFSLVSNENHSNLCYADSAMVALKNHSFFSRDLRQMRPTWTCTKPRFEAAACLTRDSGDYALRKPLRQFLELVVTNCMQRPIRSSAEIQAYKKRLEAYKKTLKQHTNESGPSFMLRVEHELPQNGIKAQINKFMDPMVKSEEKIVKQWFRARLNDLFDAYNLEDNYKALDESIMMNLRHEAFLAGFEDANMQQETAQMDSFQFFDKLMGLIDYVPCKLNNLANNSRFIDVAPDNDAFLLAQNQLAAATDDDSRQLALTQVQRLKATIQSAITDRLQGSVLECQDDTPPSMLPFSVGRYALTREPVSINPAAQILSSTSEKRVEILNDEDLERFTKTDEEETLEPGDFERLTQEPLQPSNSIKSTLSPSNIGEARTIKIQLPISIPDILQLPNQNKKIFTFELSAVTVHSGSTANGGHYYSYCRNEEGTWFKFDDMGNPKVCAVEWANIKDEVQTKACIVYYRNLPPPPAPEDGDIPPPPA